MNPPPLHAAASNESLSSTASNPSTASTVKDEIKGLIGGFVSNLNATLVRNGINELTLVNAANSNAVASERQPRQERETAFTIVHPGVTCDHCNEPIQGIRYKVSQISSYYARMVDSWTYVLSVSVLELRRF
jgi:hypothetical protein